MMEGIILVDDVKLQHNMRGDMSHICCEMDLSFQGSTLDDFFVTRPDYEYVITVTSVTAISLYIRSRLRFGGFAT
jgi:hypothetical protein